MARSGAGNSVANIRSLAAATALSVTGAACLWLPPALTADTGGLQQQCIRAALAMPKIKHAYVVHPGHKPYEHSPTKVGAVQTTVVSLRFAAVAPTGQLIGQCDSEHVHRVVKARLQKTVNGRWRYLGTTWGYKGNTSGYATGIHQDNGHGEAAWEYLKPGEKERLAVYLKAEEPETGRTVASVTRSIRVKIVGRPHPHS